MELVSPNWNGKLFKETSNYIIHLLVPKIILQILTRNMDSGSPQLLSAAKKKAQEDDEDKKREERVEERRGRERNG